MSTRSGRYDAMLLAGLTCALLVIFARPIRVVLDAARAFEDSHGLSLVPALVILTAVFVFQQQAKRTESATRAATAAAEVEHARARAEELEELVGFGRSLAEALDFDAVKEATWRHVPALVGTRAVWVLVREPGGWRGLMGVSGAATATTIPRDVLNVAATALGRCDAEPGAAWIETGRFVAFPMIAAGTVVGVLGTAADVEPLTAGNRRVLAAAAAVLAIAVRNVQLFAQIRESNVHDPLTGCLTRAYAQELLDAEFRRARRSGQPLSAVMFDLDHFKQVNDRLGHLAGDAVLSAIGRQLREVLRGSDVKCRYGGEEFLILLPDTPAPGAMRVAESLRQAFDEMTVRWEGAGVPVTASFGVAALRAGERDPQALVASADAALYRAKQCGRNCVRVADDNPPAPAEASHRLALVSPAITSS